LTGNPRRGKGEGWFVKKDKVGEIRTVDVGLN
jgi:hypothetical protein